MDREGKDTMKTHKSVIFHTRVAEAPIFTKIGTVVDPTYLMAYAHFGWYRWKGGHFAAVQNLPFSHDFNGWPYNRQALTCCRDALYG